MTRVVLVRHGESLWNVERRIQGQSGAGLSEVGHEQAAITGAWLAEAHPGAVVVASDLERCRETCAPIAAALDVEPSFDVGLRERAFGDWTGLLGEEVATRDPDRWERWRGGEDVVGEVGGEDTPTLVERVTAAVERHVATAGDRTLIVVTHGGPVWHGTTGLLGLPPRVLGGVANASLTELVRADSAPAGGAAGDGGWRLATWNQTAHLPESLRHSPRAADVPAARRPPPVGA